MSVPSSALKSLFYKEWLKLRLLAWIPVALMLWQISNYQLAFDHMINTRGAMLSYLTLYLQQQVFFTPLRWLFVYSAVFWALLQILPETVDDRMRLVMHLPVSRRRALTVPVITGLGLVLGFGALTALALMRVHRRWAFPDEIAVPLTLTIVPWVMAGVVAWCATAAFLSEPVRYKKAAILLFGVLTIDLLTRLGGFNPLGHDPLGFTLLILPWPFIAFYAPFRQGAA